MTGMAYFFRNVKDIDELNHKTINAKTNNDKLQKYRIIKKVILTEDDFIKFQKSFLETKSFIKEITYQLTMNNNAEYLCILVVSKNSDYGFLINSSGYSYARTLAIIKIGENYGI